MTLGQKLKTLLKDNRMTQDYDFHENFVQIAENVVHVDYCQQGFTVYLTEDGKLYGMGCAGTGAL